MSHSFRLSRRLGVLENYNNKRQISEHCRYAAVSFLFCFVLVCLLFLNLFFWNPQMLDIRWRHCFTWWFDDLNVFFLFWLKNKTKKKKNLPKISPWQQTKWMNFQNIMFILFILREQKKIDRYVYMMLWLIQSNNIWWIRFFCEWMNEWNGLCIIIIKTKEMHNHIDAMMMMMIQDWNENMCGRMNKWIGSWTKKMIMVALHCH